MRIRVFNYLDGYMGVPTVRWQASTVAQTQNSRIYFTSPNDPERMSYSSYVAFQDPDGNAWIVQEVTKRAPGRELPK